MPARAREVYFILFTPILYPINTICHMRPHGKNIERVPDVEEVRQSIDEHEDLKATQKIRTEMIQQILDM